MRVERYSLVIVPGRGNSGPAHWQSVLQASHDNATRVIQKHWKLPVRCQWVGALDGVVRRLDAPSILVGHSAGVLTIVHWAAQASRQPPVVGALLVAPPDMESRLPGLPPPFLARLAGWTPIPKQPLPWKSIVVASANDPMCSIARARSFAQAWGSRFIDLGMAGHINANAGFGPWPGVDLLIDSLLAASPA